eukprot:6180057-Pleurochrysis_carterae.AAC.2
MQRSFSVEQKLGSRGDDTFASSNSAGSSCGSQRALVRSFFMARVTPPRRCRSQSVAAAAAAALPGHRRRQRRRRRRPPLARPAAAALGCTSRRARLINAVSTERARSPTTSSRVSSRRSSNVHKDGQYYRTHCYRTHVLSNVIISMNMKLSAKLHVPLRHNFTACIIPHYQRFGGSALPHDSPICALCPALHCAAARYNGRPSTHHAGRPGGGGSPAWQGCKAVEHDRGPALALASPPSLRWCASICAVVAGYILIWSRNPKATEVEYWYLPSSRRDTRAQKLPSVLWKGPFRKKRSRHDLCTEATYCFSVQFALRHNVQLRGHQHRTGGQHINKFKNNFPELVLSKKFLFSVSAASLRLSVPLLISSALV